MLHRCVAPFTLSNFVVKVIEGDKVVSTYPLPELKPGGSSEIKVGRLSSKATLVIENKQGIRVYDSALKIIRNSGNDSVALQQNKKR